MNYRDNYIRNIKFQNPEYIPVDVHVSMASRDLYRGDMESVMVRYPEFFSGFEKGKIDYDNYDYGPANTKGVDFKDSWGCTWRTCFNGIEGVVIDSPIKTHDDYKTYRIPDALTQNDRRARNWEQEKKNIDELKKNEQLTFGGLSHGFTFLRLQYIRGFEDLIYDMYEDEPCLYELIEKIDQYNLTVVNKYADMNVDIMELPEDLGAQNSLMISPEMFRKWISPSYKKMIAPCKEKGIFTSIHSDGYIMEIADDLVQMGMDIINPQDLCNGIDNIARELKGKACIRLDIDRTRIVPYGSRKDIHDLIEEEVRKLGSKQGGLEFIAGIYPPTSPEKVEALCDALLKYRTYWRE